MKIVFLDVDGVLNHACTKEHFQAYNGIDERNLQYFAEFVKLACEEEDTKIAVLMKGNYLINSWSNTGTLVDFYLIKGVL